MRWWCNKTQVKSRRSEYHLGEVLNNTVREIHSLQKQLQTETKKKRERSQDE